MAAMKMQSTWRTWRTGLAARPECLLGEPSGMKSEHERLVSHTYGTRWLRASGHGARTDGGTLTAPDGYARRE
eukprot:899067-Prymnesium_polylepis.1